ncbi:hypothetical protein [Streptomyces pseudovenezuelae]|uniref:Secreted protein n=1 Tax=Streptomyces pseudovenezuelae TaxID=67350 RepID=A0ABT6LPZ6_9ACTN|nr:hypothetical protein [Streptomyces pseudovenezuelae]MDH6218373.1 hypothetical protein [Streptomyces pseudovenezuelae]
MRRITKATAQAAVAAVGLSACLVVGASPAQAAVDDCKASFNGEDNLAQAVCSSGFGAYRVKSKCDSPNYPYQITIYGPWVNRYSGQAHPPYSNVDGDRYNCHIISAQVDV